MTARNVAGTETFPDGNSNNDDFDDEINKGDFKNLIELYHIKNFFIYLVFLITFTTVGNKIKNIIGTFDTTDKREYITMTGIINLFSTCVYYGMFSVSILLKAMIYINGILLVKIIIKIMAKIIVQLCIALYVFYIIFVCTIFNYNDDKVKEGILLQLGYLYHYFGISNIHYFKTSFRQR